MDYTYGDPGGWMGGSLGVDRFVIISGCSGGGKSSLQEELRRRGYPTIAEPGRRIVKDQLLGGGAALPWTDGVAFARRCIALALSDRKAARRLQGRWVFFDRGLIDASIALRHLIPASDESQMW
jgi:predicted ATPase